MNLILSAATGYTLEQITNFLKSLSLCGYKDKIVILVDTLSKANQLDLKKSYNIDFIQTKNIIFHSVFGNRLLNRGRMRFVHRMARLLGSVSVKQKYPWFFHILEPFFHVACSRYFYYLNFLYPRRNSYNRVFLTDLRDVFFQTNPFSHEDLMGLSLYYDADLRLGDEPINTGWFKSAFGEDIYDRYKGERITCSGTTMGGTSSIVDYLRAMCCVMVNVLPQIVGQLGVDQSIHNYLIWKNILKNFHIFENFSHNVATLKNEPSTSLKFDSAGRLLNNDGSLVPVLHQYDFHSPLVALRHKLEKPEAPSA